MVETEEKYLLAGSLRDALGALGVTESRYVRQGYLLVEGDSHFRVRVSYGIGGAEATMTYKSGKGVTRTEVECAMDLTEAEALLSSCKRTVSKERHTAVYDGCRVDVDVYPHGLRVVEIEADAGGRFPSVLPACCGERVTDSEEYSNLRLAERSASLPPAIVRNSIVTPDGTVLTSRHVHNCVFHTDSVDGQLYMADGGLDYLRRAGPSYTEASVSADAPYETLRRAIEWMDGDGEYVSLADTSTEQLVHFVSGGRSGRLCEYFYRELSRR